MRRVLRILWCAGMLLGGWALGAQQPATISGDKAVRFEQSPGFSHYAAICRTGTRFTGEMPAVRPPLEESEPAVCWYVKGAKMAGPGSGAPEADGKLVISAHHVRFMPHNPQFVSFYMDLLPEEVALTHDPGQPYGTLRSKELTFTFRFSKLCPECPPGTAVTPGFVPALLDQEFTLLDAGIRHFDVGWKQIWRLSSGQQPAPAAAAAAPLAAASRPAPQPSAPPRPVSQPTAPPRPAPAPPAPSSASAPVAAAAIASRPEPEVPADQVHPPAPRRAIAANTPAPEPNTAMAPHTKPVKIAPEAASGRLLKKVAPAYPLEAKLVRLEGTVVVRAVIEKTGEVAEVYALSGPPLLESAAVDAVRQWQYRPYTIKGQPVDVETTIGVVFALDGVRPAARAPGLK